MRVGFIGDPHTGRMRNLLGAERGDRAHAALWKSQIQHARDRRCTHAVIVGDVFDTPHPDQEQLLLVLSALSRADDLRFLVYPGNHDVHDAATNSLRLLCRMPEAGALRHVKFVMEPRVVSWGGLRVRVVPWGATVPPGDGVDLTVHHEAVVGARMDNQHEVPVGAGLSAARLGRLSVGGHLHTPQPGFCGTGAQLSFGELPEKRFSLVDFGARTPSVETYPIQPPWRLKTVTWSADAPPSCDEDGTYYRVMMGGDPPPHRWLIDHPRVVRTQGAKRTQAAVGKVVVADGGAVDTEDDDALLSKYLRAHTALDALARARAMKLHARMRRSQ